LACATSGDFSVLTKNTTQLATAEKHGTGATLTADRRLFPKMQSGAGNFQFCRCGAKSRSFFSVKLTVSGTQSATLHNFTAFLVLSQV
jgi:hypothetical protein